MFYFGDQMNNLYKNNKIIISINEYVGQMLKTKIKTKKIDLKKKYFFLCKYFGV